MSPSIPKTMRAVQLMQYNEKLEIHDIPVPKLGDNDVLVKMGAAGWCHTDYQVWQGVYESPTPIVPSHEPVGTIIALGPKVEESGKWKVGQRVGIILFQHACHECVGCRTTSDVRFCKNQELAGLKNNGGMAQYMVGDADGIVALPHDLPFEQAAPLLCAGATTWAGLMAAEVQGPAPIGVIGIGGLGSLAIQFAKALGHPVVAVDNRPEGLALASEVPLPADLVLDFNDKDVLSKIQSWAGRGGLAAVLVTTDNLEPIEWCLNTLRPHGIAVPIGLPTESIKFNAFTLIFQELTVKGSVVATRLQVEDMLKVVDKFGIRSHVTTFGIEDAPKVTEWYMAKDLKGRLVLNFED